MMYFFLITIDQKTMCNMKHTYNYHPNYPQLYIVFYHLSAHCLAVLHVNCVGSLSALS